MKFLMILAIALSSFSAFADNNKSPREIKMRKICRGELDGFGITKACESEEQEGKFWLFGHATTAGAPRRVLFLKVIELDGKACAEPVMYSNWDREVSKEIEGKNIFKTPKGEYRVVLDEENGRIHAVGKDNKIVANSSEKVSCADSL